ncbi:UbiH/UbiF/VisC/COQ6 family ubiquinone biosynthesis hydroxylase [Halomonas huangheensis]|uniref:FAD-binding domain-containing protein n=1 Tax=Halomonas huangheensis TaxID=1178482 RepID=W1N673_9GAMM|nr:UbiH/UbiF/VisC/COQ6 family ubiquinone biosynthesis hydroxylase [Halomonas huangheensis]ALM50884.1 2-octaprenyl-3-methyl-6-methoxy-1,4-benzoquinol hydroxylase [Halomonas huangheensis]ERL51023.1 hypothetical protein BJB45_20745 [Halomonas huangheensis]
MTVETEHMQQDVLGHQQHDVVVVGIGMVGATLAVLLGREGLSVAMVDPRPDALALESVGEGLPSPRVSALTPVSQRLLEGLGVWPLISARRATPYTAMQVWDGEGSGDIRFRADQAGVPVLGHIVENDVVLAALESRLAQMPNVTRLYGQRVASLGDDPESPQVALESGARLNASLIVAADGARSPLRDMAGIAISERDTGHHALVTTVRTAHPHAATARQAFLATGPLAFLPLTVEGDSHYCSIVWSTSPQHAARLTTLAREAVAEELAQAFDHRLGKVEVLDDVHGFPLSQRHAERYYLPGLVLIGDAAHSIHPLAGQGVNLGLMDAAVLAEELLQARQRGCEPGEEWQLARYQRRRRGDNASMLALMDGFRLLFGARHPALTLARNLGLSGVNRLSPLKRLIMQQATGQRGHLPHSCR